MDIGKMTPWDQVKAALESKSGKGFDEQALVTALKTKIFGQDRAIAQVAAQIKRSMGRMQGSGGKMQRPLGVFLIAGPSCTGKSLLAKALAENLYGGKGQLQSYAMEQYAQPGGRGELFGTAEGMIGGKGRLTNGLQQNPRLIVEFDGIEKTYADTLKTIVTGLKDAYFTDIRTGDRVSNSEALFFMTTQTAASELVRADADNADNPMRRQDAIADALQRAGFSREFVDRLEDTFVFQPLDNPSLARLAAAEIKKIVAVYGLTVTKIDSRYLFLLVSDEESRSGGLRNIGRRVEFELGDQFIALREKGVKSIVIGQEEGRPVATESAAPSAPNS